jgi:hypothetical protein
MWNIYSQGHILSTAAVDALTLETNMMRISKAKQNFNFVFNM